MIIPPYIRGYDSPDLVPGKGAIESKFGTNFYCNTEGQVITVESFVSPEEITILSLTRGEYPNESVQIAEYPNGSVVLRYVSGGKFFTDFEFTYNSMTLEVELQIPAIFNEDTGELNSEEADIMMGIFESFRLDSNAFGSLFQEYYFSRTSKLGSVLKGFYYSMEGYLP